MKGIQTHDSAPFPTVSLRCAPFVVGPLPPRGRLKQVARMGYSYKTAHDNYIP